MKQFRHAIQRAVVVLIVCHFSLLTASAQVRFGYFSYESALKALPDYALTQKRLADLRQQYDTEMQRAEDEFNRKYEEFLDGQREFAPSILQKRQAELQEILNKNLAFKQEANRLLAQAESEAMAPLHEKLSTMLTAIGREQGLAFILNTDNYACPYVDPEQGINIEPLLKQAGNR
ncbi:MAG: OmpH family outer membrane protein [Prevotella sp.]|nr:OmpH family outer membrane protein [Prevotella sp.]